MQILKAALCRMRLTDHSQLAVSVREPGKHELFLGPLAELFYGFFCLKMLNSTQMWVVCLFVVRTHFQMFSPRCPIESLDRPGCDNVVATSKCILSVSLFFLVTKETNSIICFAGFPLLYMHSLQRTQCSATNESEFRSNFR